MRRPVLLRLVTVVVLTAVTGAGMTAVAPAATAATCSSGDGVSVVVDFHELGGGVRTSCESGGGLSAARFFDAAGFRLTRVQVQPGFVCRVNGLPASDPCQRTPPANAYWSLWWSDASSGRWTYATVGVDSLNVPRGGYVALSWSTGSSPVRPGVAPVRAEPAPAPSPSTSSPAASPDPTAPAIVQPPASPPAGQETGRGEASGSASPVRSPVPQGDATPAPVADDQIQTTSARRGTALVGLPDWLAPLLIGLLLGGLALRGLRRRSGGPR